MFTCEPECADAVHGSGVFEHYFELMVGIIGVEVCECADSVCAEAVVIGDGVLFDDWLPVWMWMVRFGEGLVSFTEGIEGVSADAGVGMLKACVEGFTGGIALE